MADVRGFAVKIETALARLPVLRDVQLAEALDYPTVDVDIDRVRAGQLGVSVDQIAASVADATSSACLSTRTSGSIRKAGFRIALECLCRNI
jgi:multidrug efflux pump subunit AcrB